MFDISLSDFAISIQRAETAGDLWSRALRFSEDRGITRLSCHLVEPLQHGPRQKVHAYGFPEDWVAHYLSAGLIAHDPIPALAARRNQPFHWSDIRRLSHLTMQEHAVLRDLEEADLGDGLAMQVHGPSLRSAYVGLGFGHRPDRLPETEVFELKAAAQLAHLRYCEITAERHAISRDLSPREREVLGWIAKGKSNNVIADIVGLSPHTIDTVVRRIFDKLDVTDRTTAALRGLGAGLVYLDPSDIAV